MKRRIFLVLTTMSMALILILCAVTALIYYNFYKTQSENDIKAFAHLFIVADNNQDALDSNLLQQFPYEVRITLIDSGGNVDFDTKRNVVFENHLDREEVQEAFSFGEGEAIRQSETLGKDAYYYAMKYGDDKVIRFSRQFQSISGVFVSTLPFIVVAAFIVVLISTLAASKLADSLIRPVNTLVERLNIFRKGPACDRLPDTDYEELLPLAKTIRELAQKADDYITRLQEEKRTITLITDNMTEGMILLNSSMNILSVNRSAIHILHPGFTLDKTKNILQLTRSHEILTSIESVQSGEAPAANSLIKTDEGKHYRVFVNKAPLDSGSFGMIVLLVDVTESIHVEEIRRDFAANVSHELKTPLTTIKGFGEMLSAGIVSERMEVARCGATIYRESERLLHLITDIIRLSEIEEVGNASEKAPLNLLECAYEVRVILQDTALEKGIALTVEGEDAVLTGNRSYLNELIMNLADNAIKYNNRNGSVLIKVINHESEVELTIKDDGIGIPKEHQDRIFERFYRVDKSRSKQTGGTGLGLSIVKHIVFFHNGTLSLKSEEGLGTEITVRLPK